MRTVALPISVLVSCLILTAQPASSENNSPNGSQDPTAAATPQSMAPKRSGASAASGPDLNIQVTHTSSFLRGQTNAVYLIRVANGGDSETSGAISVVESMPSGISITAMSGPGWSCSSSTCSRSDSFPAGRMLPTITVLASVDANAPASVSNLVTVSGGGDSNISDNVATDVTSIASEGWLFGQQNSLLVSAASLAPRTVSDAVAIAVSRLGGLALRKDGTVMQWVVDSSNSWTPPAGLKDVVAVAAGDTAFFALKSDGNVVAWSTFYGVPVTSGLSNIVSVVSAWNYALALNADGTVVPMSLSSPTETLIPASLANVVQLSAGTSGAFALTADGDVVSWGSRVPPTPANLGKLVRVERVDLDTAAGIRADGTVVVWDKSGTNELLTVPSGLSRVVALAGDTYVMALKDDGVVRAWGPSASPQPKWPNVALMASSLASTRAMAATTDYYLTILSAPPVMLSVQVTAQHFNVKNYAIDSPKFSIDGISSTYFNAIRTAPGGTHTLSTEATQYSTGKWVEWNFSSWSDGGAATHNLTLGANDAEFTLDYKPRVRLATTAGTGGTISPAGTFYDIGTSVLFQAIPLPGYVFSSFQSAYLGTSGNNPARFVVSNPDSLTASFVAQGGTSIRATLQPAGPFVQGQKNAVFVGRVHNEGSTAVNGATATFTNLTITSLWGTGWNCANGTCSRNDSLPAGQAYPAILVVATLPSSTTDTVRPVMRVVPSGGSSIETAAPLEMSGAGNSVTGWGDNSNGQASPPGGLSNLAGISAGAHHTVALRADGTLSAWGLNDKQQTQSPGGLGNVIAIAAGADHTLALSSAGQVTAWGDNTSGQATVPGTLTGVIAVAAGSQHSLALTSAGAVVAWGANGSGQATVPGTVKDAVAIAAGGDHSLAVLRDGTVIAWGSNGAGESSVPGGLNEVESVAAGAQFSLAMRRNGTLAVWGNTPASIQSGLPSGLTNLRQVAAGGAHAMALKSDGSLKAWGANDKGQVSTPAALKSVAFIAGGAAHSVAVTAVPPQASVSFSTQPAGLAYVIDGETFTTSQTFSWVAGSTHTAEVVPIQAASAAGTRYVLQGWSDGGAATKRSFTSWGSDTLSISFKTQYLLTTTTSPGGAILPATGYQDSNYQARVSAAAAPGYSFSGFTGDLTGSSNPQPLTMSAPRSVHAVFSPVPPSASAVSVSPSSGSGAAAAFAATYSASFGYTDLRYVQFLFAAAADGGGQPFCYLHYDVPGDGFWLYGDSGFFVGPVKPGVTSSILQNTLCAINTKTSTVWGSGTTLTLTANPVFKSAAALKVYMRAYTMGQIDTGWVQRGTWTTVPTAMGSMSVQPAAGTGGQGSFTLSYPEPPGAAGLATPWSQFLIAAAADGGGQPFCFVHYDHAGNGLWMYSGDVGFFLGPVSPGTTSTALDSSACSVNTGQTTVSRPAGVVTVTVPVILKAPMAGAKNLYMRILDPLYRDSGWVKTGTWTGP